jgi:phosphoglycolate phosphatase
MPYSFVIFDLDGTLADSFPWLQRNVNDVADRFGFRRVTENDVETLRHASTREILDRLEVPLWKLPFIARHMRRLKTEQAASIPLFDGVGEMLMTLAKSGVRLALVSSDTEANAREKLGTSTALFADFDCAASIFGKPARFRRVLKRAGVSAAEAIAIGDETRDIEAARGRHRLRRGDLGLRGAERAEGAPARSRLRADGGYRAQIDRNVRRA